MPRQQVKKVLTSRNRSRVRTCYERRLKVNNALQGTIALRLRVDAGGRVAATQASGSLRDNEVFSCVRNLAKEWQFPPPEGGDCAVVAVPFNFTPKL
ncbi:MAG: AgmX/PglI C-terminal domain-containing protein [Proteobacteria bacterium]|nr:AgmX/PglI C-terminal domain-containing protein [Pseudomonadota bacterium]